MEQQHFINPIHMPGEFMAGCVNPSHELRLNSIKKVEELLATVRSQMPKKHRITIPERFRQANI